MTRIPTPDSRIQTLYAILDDEVAERAGWTLVDLAAAYLDGGARFLQIRAKKARSAWLLDVASAVVELARTAGAAVVLNDRADIARLAGADGVHVGQEDLPPAAVRTILCGNDIVGLSTHTLAQVEAATGEPVGYVAVGPVFSTTTKVTGYDSVGLDMVRRAAALTREHAVPLVAIGGITLETAPEVIRAGAAAVAVISDLLTTGDPSSRVRAYVERLAAVSKV